ncbi:MAG: TlpA disulfide reductase family protein [Proteobacteria bacterium]|nr:TlpA disulfide reductase family protein [Pseudomonadota bacterium]
MLRLPNSLTTLFLVVNMADIAVAVAAAGATSMQAPKVNPSGKAESKIYKDPLGASDASKSKTAAPAPNKSAKAGVQDFTLKDIDGKSFNLKAALAASDAGVVINFWASWCTACADEIPELIAFQKKYPKYTFFVLNVGEDLSKAQKFVRRNSYPYKIILDPSEEVLKKFGFEGLPVTVVISKAGEVIFSGNRPPKSLSEP